MKFLHVKMGYVSRSTGRSCVQSVAYITRSALFEERRGIHANYTNVKDHEVFWETLAPEGPGIGRKNLSFWNKLDQYEDGYAVKRYRTPQAIEKYLNSVRTSQTYVFALPKELSQSENIELLREFIQERYVERGLMATYAIHWEEGNPHTHINVSTRTGWNGEISWTKQASRELDGRPGIRETRKIYADIINKYQEMAGLEDRVNPLSYAEQGLELIPTKHKGYMAHQLERDGSFSRIAEENARIMEENKQRIAEFPSIILKELTSTQATFSEMDVVRLMQQRLKDDIGILGDHVLHGVMEQAVEVGTGIDNFKRYTSQEYADKEARILGSFEKYQSCKTHLKIDPAKVEAFIAKLQEQGKETKIVPNEGQINGIRTLCGDSQVYVMIGRAGTGKTTTMKSVVKLHEDAGFRVIGMAPSATAASQLEADTGCKSDTIAHYAYYWNKYDEALKRLYAATTDREMSIAQKAIDKYSAYLPNSNTVIIVDEAGMVGVGDHKGQIPGGWDAITKAINNTGAKLILTGDDHQFKPVESGDVFRRLVYQLKDEGQEGGSLQLCELTEIVRQNIPWMRDASKHLAEMNVSTALGMYEAHGHIEGYPSNIEAYEAIAQQYLRNMIREPDSRGIVVVSTNKERLALNREIRSILKGSGHLAQEDVFYQGEDGYCVGDKIIFTKNDRGWNTKFESKEEGFFVQNSMQAIIQSIKPVRIKDQETGEITETYEIVAQVFGKATIRFSLENFKDFSHSYAVTGFKSQGDTLDWVLVKASRVMNAHGLYVCLTRHRQDISLYYSQEEFVSYQALINSLSRVNVKDLVIDYSVSDEHQEYWQNVQDYKETGRELQGIRTLARSLREPTFGRKPIFGNKENKEELQSVWEDYRHVEEDRKSWAKHILADWEAHKDFVRQAGLTRESLEIAAGLKKRSLSRVEKEAQQTVEQYISIALETRQLWQNIRRTHPGIRAKSHPEWPKFEDTRKQRGIFANQICLNPTLYRPFLKETAEQLAKADIGYVSKDNKVSYSMATIKAQAETHQSKMLQAELLKDNAEGRRSTLCRPPPSLQDRLKVLIAYIEARDHFGQMWAETKPKRDALKDSLLEGSLAKELSDCMKMGAVRDGYAVGIFEKREEFEALAKKVGIKINFDRLPEEAARGRAHNLIKTYRTSKEVTTKLEAAFEINSLMKGEADLKNKPTISQVFAQGLQPKDIARDAHEYQKIKLFESLKTEPERDLFLLLDDYDAKCRKANQIYSLCIEDTKGKDKKPWESSHYPDYKDFCHSRNNLTLEIFDQRDHNQVIAMAESMGIRFKDVELEGIFSRCEQATRTNNIISYQSVKDPEGQDPEAKGKAAVALRQMINFERRDKSSPSLTARQAFYAGIDFKELQTIAFEYGRSCVLKGLSSQEEIDIYRALEAYENALRPASRAYKGCIDESKEKTTKDLEVKPWETEKFKEYLSLVAIQDEKAYELIKGVEGRHPYDAPTVTKVAQQMGISVKKLDVEAHRHSLRQTLQTFMEGDRTNVPMAGQELLNWLEFDRHSDHKHTFKVLREQDFWPKDIFESLQDFIGKKREWRHEEQRGIKDAAKAQTQGHNSFKPKYKIITYERRQSFEEVNQQLSDRMYELATHILGKPTSKNRDSLRFGKKGSVSVYISGKKQGIYTNFETTGKGVGALGMIEEQMGLSTRDAIEWGRNWLGGNPVIEQRVVQNHQKEGKFSTWTPITPVPKEAPPPDIEGNKYLNYMLKDGAKETHRHAYRDAEGNLKGYVFRIEKADGSKITPPLAYCQNERGFKAWKWQGFEKENKTPYGIERLAQHPNNQILVVEGEKTANASQKLLPDYNVLTWSGGAGSVGKTNWEYLADKDVVIWPDNDEGGLKAAETLQKIVTALNAEKSLQGMVGIIPLPENLPEKWDLADKLPQGWTIDTVKEMIKETLPLKDKSILGPEGAIKAGTHGRNYTFQEKQILDYLRQELTAEKTSWLEKSDLEKFLKAAEENPTHTLQRWQKITDDYRFELTTDKQEKLNEQQQEAIKLQEKEIIVYLYNEVRTDKHKWLPPDYAESIRNAAKDDPFATLKRWKDLSGDSSFEPSIPDALISEEQKKIKHNVLTYLKEDMQRTHAEGIDERTQQKILKLAETKPDKGLQEWQLLTENYRFNPYADVTGKRELKVNEYLKENLAQQSEKLSKNIKREITAHLHRDPLKAYNLWQIYTNDKTFDPKTGVPTLETQAQKLMDSIKTPVPDDLLKSWKDQIINKPEVVLKECQEFIQAKGAKDALHKNVNQFIHLSETYEKLSWDDPQRNKIEKNLKKITDRYLDDKEFTQKIEGSKSEAASERLADEKMEKNRALSRNLGDRGMGM